jgi:phosphohistidine phosphatase SixA
MLSTSEEGMEVMGTAFSEWQDLSDAYARELEALVRHEPGASETLLRLQKQLAECEAGFKDSGISVL